MLELWKFMILRLVIPSFIGAALFYLGAYSFYSWLIAVDQPAQVMALACLSFSAISLAFVSRIACSAIERTSTPPTPAVSPDPEPAEGE